MKAITLNDFFESTKGKSNYRQELRDKQKVDSYKTLKSNIKPGEIIVIASRPGEGKTNFLFNLLVDQVNEKDEKVLLISVRNKPDTNVIQILSIAEQKKNTSSTFLDNIVLNDKQMYSKNEVIDFIHEVLSQNHNIKAIYIDDLHRLSFVAQLFPYEEDFWQYDSLDCHDSGPFFNILTTISAKFGILIFLTTEFKNSSVQRSGSQKPRFGDLLISKLEFIADKMLFLFRPTYHGFTEDESGNSTNFLLEVKIAKNKNGEADKTINLIARDMIILDDMIDFDDMINLNYDEYSAYFESNDSGKN